MFTCYFVLLVSFVAKGHFLYLCIVNSGANNNILHLISIRIFTAGLTSKIGRNILVWNLIARRADVPSTRKANHYKSGYSALANNGTSTGAPNQQTSVVASRAYV